MLAIKNVEQLKQHCDEDPYNEFVMLLNYGLRSTKRIQYWKDSDSWCIMNEIDDSESDYGSTEEFKQNEPLIFKAMANNAFYMESE